jgi:hypothetical protein
LAVVVESNSLRKVIACSGGVMKWISADNESGHENPKCYEK